MVRNVQQTEEGCLAVSAADLAKRLGISERHLWAMHADGRLGPEPIAFGRSKRWAVAEIQRWLAAGGPPRGEWKRLQSEPAPG